MNMQVAKKNLGIINDFLWRIEINPLWSYKTLNQIHKSHSHHEDCPSTEPGGTSEPHPINPRRNRNRKTLEY